MESKANGGGREKAKTLWIRGLRTNRVFLHYGFDLVDDRDAKFLKGEKLPRAQLIYFRNGRGARFRAV